MQVPENSLCELITTIVKREMEVHSNIASKKKIKQLQLAICSRNLLSLLIKIKNPAKYLKDHVKILPDHQCAAMTRCTTFV